MLLGQTPKRKPCTHVLVSGTRVAQETMPKRQDTSVMAWASCTQSPSEEQWPGIENWPCPSLQPTVRGVGKGPITKTLLCTLQSPRPRDSGKHVSVLGHVQEGTEQCCYHLSLLPRLEASRYPSAGSVWPYNGTQLSNKKELTRNARNNHMRKSQKTLLSEIHISLAQESVCPTIPF